LTELELPTLGESSGSIKKPEVINGLYIQNV